MRLNLPAANALIKQLNPDSGKVPSQAVAWLSSLLMMTSCLLDSKLDRRVDSVDRWVNFHIQRSTDPQQIGLANGTSVATVRTHVRAVLERLGAQRITDVVRMLHQGEAHWSKATT